MSGGLKMAQQIEYGKKTTLKPNLVVIGVIVLIMAAILLASVLLGFIPWLNQPGEATNAPKTATSGDGSPAGPPAPTTTTPTPTIPTEVRNMNFSQLIKAGMLDTPEKIRQFMIDYPFRYSSSDHIRYKPQELLEAGGLGYYDDFANFFGEALKSQGCWDKWNPQWVGFRIIKNRVDISPMRLVVAFHDIRDGNNKYFLPDPEVSTPQGIEKFPIYNMGKKTDPVTFEEKRLGGEREPGSGGASYFCM